MIDTLNAIAPSALAYPGTFIGGLVIGLGVIFTAGKKFGPKNMTITFGKGTSNTTSTDKHIPCDMHLDLVAKVDRVEQNQTETTNCLIRVETNAAWLKEKHDGYSAQTMFEQIISKLDK